ncbi:hypothetical protein MKW92_002928, partial [Papaver armeniacum]
VLIDYQVLSCFHQLLTQNYSKNIKRETCWDISNITAGNVDQILKLAYVLEQDAIEANVDQILKLAYVLCQFSLLSD